MQDKQNKKPKAIVSPDDIPGMANQINTNTNNINTQITLTDINTTDIAELRATINFEPGDLPVNKEEFGNLDDLTTDDKTNIVAAVNEVDANSDALEVRVAANETGIAANADNITLLFDSQENLEALTTEDKSSLVGAINELEFNSNAIDTRLTAAEPKINTNTINIANNDSRIGDLTLLTTDTKTNLVVAINEVDLVSESNTSRNDTQDIRLTQLEAATAGTVSDYTVFNGPSQEPIPNITSVALTVQPNIVRDFVSDTNQIAIWNNPGTANQSITVNKAATVEGDFYLDATQITGSTPTITIELYSLTNLQVLDSVVRLLDFSSSIDLNNVEGAFIADVAAGEEFIIRAYVDGSNEVLVSNYGGKFKISATTGELQQVFDYNVTNTSTAPGATQLEVNNYIKTLGDTKADITYVNQQDQSLFDLFDQKHNDQQNQIEQILNNPGANSAIYTTKGDGNPAIKDSMGHVLFDYSLTDDKLVLGSTTDPHKVEMNSQYGIIKMEQNQTAPDGGIGTGINLEYGDGQLMITALGVEVSSPTGNSVKEVVNVEYLNGSLGAINSEISGLDDRDETLQTQITSNETNITNLTTRVAANETAILANDVDINNLQSQITSNDTDIVNLQSKNTEQDGRLAAIEAIAAGVATIDQVLDAIHPIGAILIQSVRPTIGTWQDLGELADGQSLIGGTSTVGAVKSHGHTATFSGNALPAHNHQWGRYSKWEEVNDGKGSDYGLSRIGTYDSSGNSAEVNVAPNDASGTNNWSGYTANKSAGTPTGSVSVSNSGTDDKNRAWGLGIGPGVHIWRRTA